ncbi:AAA family ATPase [Sulfurimonas sp. NW15]|uniref:AAA family ATPase n=1 Tax=Sulfurimonas sp. NW15 TaxID=2922729 RepID=UPI003DA86D5B
MNNACFQVVGESIYFSNPLSAQEYAKKNPGTTIIRTSQTTNQVIQHTPESILQHLNKLVIAQDDAKKEIAVALYYHSLKMYYLDANGTDSSGPVMLIGPTGSGKTFIVQEACKLIDTVYIHVDTSSMVSEGIVGYNIGKLAADILQKAENDLKKAEHCVVFFDEMDKLFHPDNDEYGSEVSHQLLRFIEGTTVNIPKQDLHNGSEATALSTHKMQFILGGAFQWILDKKEQSSSGKNMGFLHNNDIPNNKKRKGVSLEDLYEEDVPKELLGRMHTIVNLYPLTQEDYYKILTQSAASPLQEFIDKINFHGDYVEIEDKVIHAIAEYASKSDLGVRSIRQILKKLFAEALFLAPNPGNTTHTIRYNKEQFYE